MEKIVIGSDHAAYDEKELVKKHLESKGFEVVDVGPDSADRCNYPDYAIALARKVAKEKLRAVLLCGSGIGVSIVANRFKGVRAALCRSVEEAKLSRQHNDSNVLCVGARISTMEEIKNMIDAWLVEEFQEGRHTERLAIFENMGIE